MTSSDGATGGGSALEAATQIGLIGDLHGDIGALLTIGRWMRERGINVLLQLGDFGVVWPGSNSSNQLSKISKRLAGQYVYWVDGNHEDHRKLRTYPIGADGTRVLRPNIVHLPRGYRTVLSSGRTFAALGGANSIDFDNRVEGATWWPEETITDADLEALGQEHVDILAGHDAPLDVPTLDAALESNAGWSPEGRVYAERGRQKFHQGFLGVSPELYLGGHYHQQVDETLGYFDGVARGFATRVVLLDMVQNGGASSALLDTATLELEFFTGRGTPVPASGPQVTELT